MGTNEFITPSPDARLLCLPAHEFDDSIELLDGVYESLNIIEQQLRRHLSDGDPLDSAALGMVRVCRAASRVVLATLSDAHGQPLNDRVERLGEVRP